MHPSEELRTRIEAAVTPSRLASRAFKRWARPHPRTSGSRFESGKVNVQAWHTGSQKRQDAASCRLIDVLVRRTMPRSTGRVG